jgi:hypothetical protein
MDKKLTTKQIKKLKEIKTKQLNDKQIINK